MASVEIDGILSAGDGSLAAAVMSAVLLDVALEVPTLELGVAFALARTLLFFLGNWCKFKDGRCGTRESRC